MLMNERLLHRNPVQYTEAEARDTTLKRLADQFKFELEVQAVDPITGQKYRMDAVAISICGKYTIGWEFKKSHRLKSDFANAMQQAIYYRRSTITDARYESHPVKRINACIVCPDWDGLHQSGRYDYPQEADGMRLLAHQFRVGVLRETKQDVLCILMGEQPIWHSQSGWTKTAENVLLGKRKTASKKMHDV
jgi:hypothetical protein